MLNPMSHVTNQRVIHDTGQTSAVIYEELSSQDINKETKDTYNVTSLIFSINTVFTHGDIRRRGACNRHG